jgi:hypothetical protein
MVSPRGKKKQSDILTPLAPNNKGMLLALNVGVN